MSSEHIHKQIKLQDMDISLSSLRITRPSEQEKMHQSLQRLGQLHPVIVRPEEKRYQVLDGFKRYYSAIHLGWDFLESRIVEVTLAEGKAIMLSYNRNGRSLLDYDEALVVFSLKSEHMLDQSAISALTGYSRSWVCRRLALVEKLETVVQDAMRMGMITNSQARALVKLPRGNQQEMMQCVTTHHLTSRESSMLVDIFLQAGSGKEQQYVLEHPREVIEQMLTREEIYDVRLSQHGNRLLKSIELLTLQQNIFIGLFTQHATDKLSETEKVILKERMGGLEKGAITIQKIINNKTWKNAG
jgi:ParB/RepB/Spo0J family partition protein